MHQPSVLSRCLGLALIAALCLTPAIHAGGQEPAKPPAANSMPGMDTDMMKLMSPGPNHKRFEAMVGTWNTHMKMWMAPNQPPVENDGTAESSMMLGGRYLVTHHKGTFMGMPFEGQGIDGYDNGTHKYMESWIDNMGTGILNLSGTCEADCKVLTETGELFDPSTGKKGTYRAVTTLIDANNYKYEAFFDDVKMMELVATRKK